MSLVMMRHRETPSGLVPDPDGKWLERVAVGKAIIMAMDAQQIASSPIHDSIREEAVIKANQWREYAKRMIEEKEV